MRRAVVILMSCLLVIPSIASGLTLEWSGGATNLTLTSATRCTLLVSPSPGESVLPPRWRLFWTGEASVADPVQILTAPGPSDAAPLCSYRSSASEEERQSRTSTAEFCGPGDGLPTGRAAYVLLLDASLAARFTVAPEFGALDAAAAATPEVTVNGGSAHQFPAALRTYRAIADTLDASRAGIVGRGLDRVRAAVLVRGAGGLADTLEILSQTDQTLVLRTPETLADDDVLVLSNGVGEAASALDLGRVEDPDPEPGVGFGPRMVPDYPFEAKDFAFIYSDGLFHIFYNLINPLVPDSLSEVEFGHAVSSNLYNWTQLPPVLHTRPGHWDDGHVWAPTIVEQDGMFFMYYTGVTKSPTAPWGIQRLGLAVSSDLYQWTRFDAPAFACGGAPWTECDYSTYEGSQFRDPFVMTDPNDPSRWLLYYVAPPDVADDQMIAGVAASPELDGAWSNLVPLWCTDGFPNNLMGWCESPMAFSKSASWFLFLSTNSGHPIRYKIATNPIADSTAWAGPFRLYDAPGAGPNSDMWIAPEFLRVNGRDYLAVVTRAAVTPGIEIREMVWGAVPAFSLVAPVATGVGAPGSAAALSLDLISPLDGRGVAELSIELAVPGAARVDLFDVSGRRVARLLDQWLPAGRSTCRWDGHSAPGTRAESGVYFARLSSRGESKVIRVPHLR